VASAVFGLLVAGGAVVVGFWTLSRQLDERADMEMKGRKELLAHVARSSLRSRTGDPRRAPRQRVRPPC
jgi:hypothetical protein